MLRLLFTVLLACVLAAPAMAADLGQVQVALPEGSQDQSARQAALQQGLKQVIARLVNKDVEQVASLPGAQKALADPHEWLLRYDMESGEPPQLQALFDTEALGRFLARHGVAVWSGPRPLILVWLVEGGSARGAVVAAGSAEAKAVVDAAQARGLRVVLPAWDDRDRQQVSVADIRGRFDKPLLQASQRYQTRWVATGVLYGKNRPTINWRLLHGDRHVAENRTRTDSREAAVHTMMDGIGDALAAHFQVSGGATDHAGLVEIHGVHTLQAWADLVQRLRDMAPVNAVHLRRANDDVIRLQVDFAGSRSDLRRAVGHLPGLRECARGQAQPTNEYQQERTSAPESSDAAGASSPLTFCER